MNGARGYKAAVWPQIAAIVIAQLRTTRNHLPRTNAGTILAWLLGTLWYGFFAGTATALAAGLPDMAVNDIRERLPIALLIVFVFWQVAPLITLSSGWSLQLKKLQIFPIANNTLFIIEAVLRLTSAPEMVLVLIGGAIGLAGNPGLNAFSPLLLLLYIPFNLMLSLGIRDWLTNAFSKSPFREIFAVALVALAILPQILLRSGSRDRVLPFFTAIANGRFAPWHAIAALSANSFSAWDVLILFAWIGLAFVFARSQYFKTLAKEETVTAPQRRRGRESTFSLSIGAFSEGVFGDPIGAMVRKDIRSLIRMPRFRVTFGLGTLLGVLICFSGLRTEAHNPPLFFERNLLSLIVVYGMLVSGEVLFWNVFGFDRQATQLYFVAPLEFTQVLRAKNIAACIFIAAQSIITIALAEALGVAADAVVVANAVLAICTITTFFLTIGNMSSVTNPRAINPAQTFRKQGGLKMQLWILLGMLLIAILVGFAMLAQWAFEAEWAYVAALLLEFAVGIICYRVSLDSAVTHGISKREEIGQTLSRNSSPVGM